MPTRAETRRACIIVLATLVVAAAAMWGQRRKAEATTESGYPEVVREVVEPVEAVWWGDSIKCVGTALDASGRICGTIEEGR